MASPPFATDETPPGGPGQGTALNGIDVVILAGGLGTRLQGVLDGRPKVLAEIHGRPFLAHLIRQLTGQGARHLVLCLGHLAGQVTGYLAAHPVGGVTVTPVIEPEPLGTAGALRLARPALTSDPVLVLNGDTYLDVEFGGWVDQHRRRGAALTLLCLEVDDTARYGRVDVDERGYCCGFVEKDAHRPGAGLISAGAYLFSSALLDRLPAFAGPSLERDVLPALPPRTIDTRRERCRFIDIGTPASLAQAAAVIPAGGAEPEGWHSGVI